MDSRAFRQVCRDDEDTLDKNVVEYVYSTFERSWLTLFTHFEEISRSNCNLTNRSRRFTGVD